RSVWRRSEPEVVRSGGAAGAAGVPTETSATHLHTEAWERQEATPWHTLHRGQGGPEGGGASARADIRGGFSQLLLRVSAGAVVVRCAGGTWTHDSAEESELCRRGGHQGIFRPRESRVDDEIPWGTSGRQAAASADLADVEGRSDGGRADKSEGRRDPAGGEPVARAVETLPTLRARSMV